MGAARQRPWIDKDMTMMSLEELKTAFGDLGHKVYDGMPMRDLFIIIANTIKGHREYNKQLDIFTADRMAWLERRINALEQKEAKRGDKAEKRRLPHWTDMGR